MSGWYRCAIISLIAACIPPGAQPGWQQRSAYGQPYTYGAQPRASTYGAPPQNRYDNEDDDDDDTGAPSSYGDANERYQGQAGGGGGGGSTWTCVAEGSIGKTLGNGPTNYENKSWPDTGQTRDEAYLKALKGCNALMGTSANLGYLNGEEVESGMCKVVDCRPTGS